nr:hypothetical protein [Tanacetum cinerariifolium]
MVPFVLSTPFVLNRGGSIKSASFLPFILLLVVIIVVVVIVVVILVVVVFVIIGVIIVVAIIGVVVVVSVSAIIKLSQMVKFVFYLLDLSSGTILLYQKLLEFNSGTSLGSWFLFLLSAFAMLAACASRATATRRSNVTYAIVSSMSPISSLSPFMMCSDVDRCVTMSNLAKSFDRYGIANANGGVTGKNVITQKPKVTLETKPYGSNSGGGAVTCHTKQFRKWENLEAYHLSKHA